MGLDQLFKEGSAIDRAEPTVWFFLGGLVILVISLAIPALRFGSLIGGLMLGVIVLPVAAWVVLQMR